MSYIRMSAIVIITYVLISGIAIPIVPQPQGWFEFPVIPGLEEKARNIIFHVPTAWTTVVAFLTSMWFGIQYLRKRDLDDDTKSEAAAGLGLMFCILATITGALWAKFNWGSFWNWDPRETSIFVLLLIYGAYFALRSAIDSEETRARLSAVYSILAGLTVPFFIFVLPRLVPSLHPSDSVISKNLKFTMGPEVRTIFFSSLAAFTVLYFWIFAILKKTNS